MATRKNNKGGSKVDAAVATPVAINEESEIVVTDADAVIYSLIAEPEEQTPHEELMAELEPVVEADAEKLDAPTDDEILAMVEAAPAAVTVGEALKGTQVCTSCKVAKNLKTDFYMVTKLSGKYRAICKDCYDLKYYGRKHGERKATKAAAKQAPIMTTPKFSRDDIVEIIKAWAAAGFDDLDKAVEDLADSIMLKVVVG